MTDEGARSKHVFDSTLIVPPQRRYPDHPPLMVKGTLLVVTAIGRFRGDTLDYTSFRSV